MLPSTTDYCANDADCATGALCILSTELVPRPMGCGTNTEVVEARLRFACQRPNDECGADSHCGAEQSCVITDNGRICQSASFFPCGVPGRPFLVAGEARVAAVRFKDDWAGAPLEPARGLSPDARATLAAYWLEAARMEHASVAAFARFTLQLMALGAPFELCQQSQLAMRDETEHARRCFALASRYSGAALGPGALQLDDALGVESLASLARLTFMEGCVGETCAALEAAEALACATDAPVRQALELIAEDERRHAELAWRFIAWALESDPSGDVRRALQLELAGLRAGVGTTDAAEPRAQAATVGAPSDIERAADGARSLVHAFELTDHGRLSDEQRRRLARVAIAEVVLPCADGLLRSHSPVAQSSLTARPA